MAKVTGAHTDNKAAKHWHFINTARGLEIKAKNLAQLIRDNAEIFGDDAIFHGCYCRAATCLRALCKLRYDTGKARNTWKGWREAMPAQMDNYLP